jgi:hypothetical protein
MVAGLAAARLRWTFVGLNMTDSLLPIIETADTNAAEYITANGVTLACREGCD